MYDTAECPQCGASQFTNSFQGRVVFIDPAKSTIAQKMGIKAEGEYAIKIR